MKKGRQFLKCINNRVSVILQDWSNPEIIVQYGYYRITRAIGI